MSAANTQQSPANPPETNQKPEPKPEPVFRDYASI